MVSNSSESVRFALTHTGLFSLRIYPHLQDMGGFFVAVLTRKSINVSLNSTQTAPHKAGKRAASQELEISAPDAKRVKVVCLYHEPSSKQVGIRRKLMSHPISMEGPLMWTQKHPRIIFGLIYYPVSQKHWRRLGLGEC
jgi:hypothetical protein